MTNRPSNVVLQRTQGRVARTPVAEPARWAHTRREIGLIDGGCE